MKKTWKEISIMVHCRFCKYAMIVKKNKRDTYRCLACHKAQTQEDKQEQLKL